MESIIFLIRYVAEPSIVGLQTNFNFPNTFMGCLKSTVIVIIILQVVIAIMIAALMGKKSTIHAVELDIEHLKQEKIAHLQVVLKSQT